MRHSPTLSVVLTAALLAACGKSEAPAPQPTTPSAAAPAEIKAPAGTYKLDPNHATLSFKVRHLGLADYHARFTKFDATIDFDPQNLERSSVVATIDPRSVRTDYAGDYKATHEDSPYGSWEEALARDARFFRADEFPQITFKSTQVEAHDGGLRVTGDLTFLGQTHPVTLQARLTGSMDKHPFTGRGALGFSATTEFNRSTWGMTGTQQYLGDAVAITFDAEFNQAAPEEPAPAPAN